jgi:Trk K+ transport system NAD-binding subunit
MIISTIPNFEVNIMLLKKTKLIGKHPIIYLTATNLDEAIKLYKAGADYVIFPEMLGGSHVSHMIKTAQDKWEDFLKYKKDHLKKLKQRKKELGIDLF